MGVEHCSHSSIARTCNEELKLESTRLESLEDDVVPQPVNLSKTSGSSRESKSLNSHATRNLAFSWGDHGVIVRHSFMKNPCHFVEESSHSHELPVSFNNEGLGKKIVSDSDGSHPRTGSETVELVLVKTFLVILAQHIPAFEWTAWKKDFIKKRNEVTCWGLWAWGKGRRARYARSEGRRGERSGWSCGPAHCARPPNFCRNFLFFAAKVGCRRSRSLGTEMNTTTFARNGHERAGWSRGYRKRGKETRLSYDLFVALPFLILEVRTSRQPQNLQNAWLCWHLSLTLLPSCRASAYQLCRALFKP
ncbi:hypothetical protein DL96DRAFT_1616492 [Flagelloscypha sp. PMI_526]|nr:hypothetical protein DL96DRAFT_1616492 [Flagelloscypha sp. PMI_526]